MYISVLTEAEFNNYLGTITVEKIKNCLPDFYIKCNLDTAKLTKTICRNFILQIIYWKVKDLLALNQNRPCYDNIYAMDDLFVMTRIYISYDISG